MPFAGCVLRWPVACWHASPATEAPLPNGVERTLCPLAPLYSFATQAEGSQPEGQEGDDVFLSFARRHSQQVCCGAGFCGPQLP